MSQGYGDQNSPYISAITNYLNSNPNSTGLQIINGVATRGSGFRDHKVKHWIGELFRRRQITSTTPGGTIWYDKIYNNASGAGSDVILLESGSNLLLESGDGILLE